MKDYEKLVAYFEACGFNCNDAIKEVENIIRYNMTGIDAISREYAMKLMCFDLGI